MSKQDELESLLEERVCLENGIVSVEVLINAVNDCFNLDMSVPTAQIIREHIDGMTISPGLHNKGGKGLVRSFLPPQINLHTFC